MEWIDKLEQTLSPPVLDFVHHNWVLLFVITGAALAWYVLASGSASRSGGKRS